MMARFWSGLRERLRGCYSVRKALLDAEEVLVLTAEAERRVVIRGRQRLLVGLGDEVDPPRGEHRRERAVQRRSRDVGQVLAQVAELDELTGSGRDGGVRGRDAHGQVAFAL